MSGRLAALAAAYADHAGLPRPSEEDVSARLALWPLWARLCSRACAAAVWWLAPALLLGRPRHMGMLPAEDFERVLWRLQGLESPLLRGGFLTVKSVVLLSCYGRRPGS